MRKYLLFLIILLIVFGYFWTKETKAAATDNVWGWAWSEKIGWISFNCYNDYDGDGTLESHCTDTGYASDYGVDIDEVTGELSGYAWSENIGWISFETGDVAGCPSGICQPSIDLVAGEVSGWARALAYGDGWDGWIHLRNDTIPNPYGVYAQAVDGYSEFYDWAWGGDDVSETAVIGWISFNCENCEGNPNCNRQDPCGTVGHSDYYVETSLVIVPPNNPPTAAFDCDPSACGSTDCIGYNDCPLVMRNYSTDTDPGDTLTSSWYIDNKIKGSPCVDEPSSCNFVPVNYLADPDYASAYSTTVELYVTDGEATTTASQNYEHRRGAYAGFRCSVDNFDWSTPCGDFTVEPGTVVSFKDNLLVNPYLDDSSYPSCCGNTINLRTWKRDGVEFGGNNSEVSIITLSSFPSTIRLEIKDNNPHGGGKTASVSYTIGGKPSVPIWREVSP